MDGAYEGDHPEQSDEHGYVYVDAPEVPEAYYEEYVTDDGEGLMQQPQDGDGSSIEYGGMEEAVYAGIVQYKKTGTFPDFILNNEDRNARSHWRLKCLKYTLLYDNLIYINKDSESGGKPRFAIRQGEVLPILKEVHDRIGHLGMKRTQAAVLQSFYWRSVRADVQRYVTKCDFCHEKKLCGKKVSKAPIDVFGPDVLEVGVRTDLQRTAGANRFSISLKGVSDEVVLSSRMMLSSYTFKPKDQHSTPHSHQQQHQPAGKRAAPREPLLEIRRRPIPIGHSLDGFHEVYANAQAHQQLQRGHWIDEEEVDGGMGEADGAGACRRKIQGGRRRAQERRLANEQKVRAAEALNQLSVPTASPTTAAAAAKKSRFGRTLHASKRRGGSAAKELSHAGNEMAEEQSVGVVDEQKQQPSSVAPVNRHSGLFNGLAARYVAEDLLKKGGAGAGVSERNGVIYELNIEHWHLPPTFSV